MVVPAGGLTLTPKQQTDLQRLLSPARLASYQPVPGLGPGSGAQVGASLDLYVYNMRLAGAMLGPLHVLEVVVRNALHEQLVKLHSRVDWWNAPTLSLVPRQETALREAVTKATNRCGKKGRPVAAGDVVATMDFGFWCGLVDRGDSQHTYERTLWQPALRHAFPHNRRNRQQMWWQLDGLRRLRNRISHHEPIHTRTLAADLSDVLLVLGYVSHDIATWVDDRALLPVLLKVPPGHSSVQHF